MFKNVLILLLNDKIFCEEPGGSGLASEATVGPGRHLENVIPL
jgi:hypothetical protein